jgi:hypothetical protein
MMSRWKLIADSPYYSTFVIGKLKMTVVTSEFERLENEYGKYPNTSGKQI